MKFMKLSLTENLTVVNEAKNLCTLKMEPKRKTGYKKNVSGEIIVCAETVFCGSNFIAIVDIRRLYAI